MDILLLLIYFVIIPMCVLLLVIWGGDKFLKKKFKPNLDYLNEIKTLKATRILNYLNVAFILFIVICIESNINIYFVIFLFLIVEIVYKRYVVNYLNNKEDSKNTQKYLIYNLYLSILGFIILCIVYFIYNSNNFIM